jgi:hypothetical protein
MLPGAYRLYARAIVHHRPPRQPWAAGFSVGLLTAPPDADGTHAQELNVEGYRRQQVAFLPPGTGATGGRQRSADRVNFADIGALTGAVTHAAIYDANDRLVAYSFVEKVEGAPGPDEVVFEAGEISVRF